jgi:hypothetical protein
MGDASSLTIREIGSPLGFVKYLSLAGRALPYRPVSFSGSMRAEFTWYPGNPIATVQVLGPQENATTINGMWKDRFIKTTTDLGLPVFGQTGVARFNGSLVPDVLTLVRIMEDFRRRGQLLEVKWDEITRHGIMTSFKSTWLRREDVEWEAEFQWISQGEAFVSSTFSLLGLFTDLVNAIMAAINALIALVNTIKGIFAWLASIANLINNLVDALVNLANSLVDLAKQVTDAVVSPFEAARNLVAGLESIKEAARQIDEVLSSIPARIQRVVDDLDEQKEADVYDAEALTRQARKAARKLRALAARKQEEVNASTINEPAPATITARQNQDLRDVSRVVYGTPNEWRNIAAYNGIRGSKLTAGAVVQIPKANSTRRG